MYLLRVDDASEHWNKENWQRMHDLCKAYDIKPIVAVIPNNEDAKLLKYPYDIGFNEKILNWIEEGWTPAMHGYNHVFISEFSGMNPVNNRSELLHALEIYPKIFVAPAHTFDKNTLIALKEESDIRIISDTIAKDIYYDDDFYFIPQQSGEVREIKLPTVTFCYHPNNMSEKSFNKLEDFIVKHKNEMISFNDLVMRKRKLDFQDKVLKSAYFMIHSFKKEKR